MCKEGKGKRRGEVRKRERGGAEKTGRKGQVRGEARRKQGEKERKGSDRLEQRGEEIGRAHV